MGRLTAVAVAVVTIAAAAVAVILLTRSSSPAAPRAATRATPAAAPSVRVAQTKLGRILVNSEGRTLYLYVKDRGTKSACSRRLAGA